jgi:hypothetical protein
MWRSVLLVEEIEDPEKRFFLLNDRCVFTFYYDAEFYEQQQHMEQNIQTLDLSFEFVCFNFVLQK